MKMNYVVLGTNDMDRATRFYDALFAPAGLQQVRPTERMTYWLGEDFALACAIPFDGEPATRGNGSMVGFKVGDAADVDSYYARALDLGGTCDGAPGQRGPRYSAYARDPDGNKLCFSD